MNEPVQLQDGLAGLKQNISLFNIFPSNTVSSSAVERSVKDKNQKNEIFVDVFEKLNVLFNSSGYVINQQIEGCVNSYDNNPRSK